MTSDKKSRIGYKKLLGYMLSLLLAAVLLWAAFRGANIKEVINILSGVSYFWIAAFIACTLFSHLIRAVRWKIILNSVKKDISIGNLFGSLMVGYGVNTVVPRLGEIARAVTIAKWENLSRSSMLGAVIVERVIDMIALSIAVLISVFIWSENLYEQLP
ncbi:MAG TPA: lysylphosphatidylglycerol synthase transmembrane domain-containing protein, partial [Ignavibacteriales bacterium]|nr:lysylphosphatidylglycerol synthase transmembrane domain-containing protein [Ignavibacteriales bacterium]